MKYLFYFQCKTSRRYVYRAFFTTRKEAMIAYRIAKIFYRDSKDTLTHGVVKYD